MVHMDGSTWLCLLPRTALSRAKAVTVLTGV